MKLLTALAALALLTLPSGQPRAEEPASKAPHPVSAFAALPFMERPDLSPDGRSVAALVSVEGRQSLVILSVAGSSPPVVIPTEGVDVDRWTWVNDDWLIVGAGRVQRAFGDDIYVSRALRVSRDGQTIRILARSSLGQNTARLIWKAHDGSARVLLGVQDSPFWGESFWPKVIEVDLATGRERRVLRSKVHVMSWYADGSGAVRMGYGYDDSRGLARVYYRPNADGAFRIIDKARVIGSDDDVDVPTLFLGTTGEALVFDRSSGFARIREYDLESQTLGADVFGVDGYDVDDIIPSADGNSLIGVGYVDTRRRIRWFDPGIAAIQAAIDRATPGRVAQIESLSRDRSRMIVHIGGADRMGAYYVFDRAAGKLALLAFQNGELKLRRMAPVKTIRYAARDGLTISAILTLPPGRDAKALPLIVMPHGGPNARDWERWDYRAQFLADRGYAVVQPNYRGSTGFGQAFAHAGDGQWGLKMQDDLVDAIDHLAKAGIADPERVCIVGGSYGGYAAMRAAGRDPNRFRCAISFAGVSDLAAMKRYDRGFLNENIATEWLESRVADLDAVSPVNHVDEVRIPILLIHGKEDLRVPVDQSRKFAEDLREAGKNVRYVELPEGDHHLSRQEDRLTFLKETEAFLARYNPAD